jgi:hypothetical protein
MHDQNIVRFIVGGSHGLLLQFKVNTNRSLNHSRLCVARNDNGLIEAGAEHATTLNRVALTCQSFSFCPQAVY